MLSNIGEVCECPICSMRFQTREHSLFAPPRPPSTHTPTPSPRSGAAGSQGASLLGKRSSQGPGGLNAGAGASDPRGIQSGGVRKTVGVLGSAAHAPASAGPSLGKGGKASSTGQTVRC
eukprot:3133704-Rhodomonas_salina.1